MNRGYVRPMPRKESGGQSAASVPAKTWRTGGTPRQAGGETIPPHDGSRPYPKSFMEPYDCN